MTTCSKVNVRFNKNDSNCQQSCARRNPFPVPCFGLSLVCTCLSRIALALHFCCARFVDDSSPTRPYLGPQNTVFLVKRLCPKKVVIGPNTFSFTLFLNILSTKYGFYTAKYGQMTETKTTSREKTGQICLLTEEKRGVSGLQVCKNSKANNNARKQLCRKTRYTVSICVSNQGGGIILCYDGGSRMGFFS